MGSAGGGVKAPDREPPKGYSGMTVLDAGGGMVCVSIGYMDERGDIQVRWIELDRPRSKQLLQLVKRAVGWRRWFHPWPKGDMEMRIEAEFRERLSRPGVSDGS